MDDNTEKNERSYEWLSELVKVSVLSWSAALLTLSYMGFFQKMDPTFIASFLWLSNGYGISRAAEKSGQKKSKTEEPTSTPKAK